MSLALPLGSFAPAEGVERPFGEPKMQVFIYNHLFSSCLVCVAFGESDLMGFFIKNLYHGVNGGCPSVTFNINEDNFSPVVHAVFFLLFW